MRISRRPNSSASGKRPVTSRRSQPGSKKNTWTCSDGLRGHVRRSEALLRRGRSRHADPLRARVRRRPPQLGKAAARVRQAISVHCLCSARLQTVRRAERSGGLQLPARHARRGRGTRSSADRARAPHWAVDGRLYRVAGCAQSSRAAFGPWFLPARAQEASDGIRRTFTSAPATSPSNSRRKARWL